MSKKKTVTLGNYISVDSATLDYTVVGISSKLRMDNRGGMGSRPSRGRVSIAEPLSLPVAERLHRHNTP